MCNVYCFWEVPLAAGIGGSIAAGGVLATTAWNIDENRTINAKNEHLLRESWDRDNSAVRRRVGDLKAAGLSPTLAAGSSAAPSGPIQLNPGHADNPLESINSDSGVKAVMAKQELLRQKVDIARTQAETDAIRQRSKLDSARFYREDRDYASLWGLRQVQHDTQSLELKYAIQHYPNRVLDAQNVSSILNNDSVISSLKKQIELDQVGRTMSRNELEHTRDVETLQRDIRIIIRDWENGIEGYPQTIGGLYSFLINKLGRMLADTIMSQPGIVPSSRDVPVDRSDPHGARIRDSFPVDEYVPYTGR